MSLGQDLWALDVNCCPWRCKGYKHDVNLNNKPNWKAVPVVIPLISLDAATTCVWACGATNEVFIFVKECDLPIRVQDYMFEYGRWYPAKGWVAANNNQFVTLKKPSANWKIEGVWCVDRNIDGSPTDPDGWQYARSFSSRFTARNTTTSYVRRKRLARYYGYNKMGTFARLEESREEPVKFDQVVAGGEELTSGNGWPICVWGLSVKKRAYYRTNVTCNNPEGSGWEEICQSDFQLEYIAVGPRGNVWGYTPAGNIVSRLGVTSHNPIGTDWIEVDLNVDRIFHIVAKSISVSSESVWLTDTQGRVFFHKGCQVFNVGNVLLTNKQDSRSRSRWLHMVMDEGVSLSFKCLSVGPGNQVWGLSKEDNIYNRTDVSPTQISGQMWQNVEDQNLVDHSIPEEEEEAEPKQEEEEEEAEPIQPINISPPASLMRSLPETLMVMMPGGVIPEEPPRASFAAAQSFQEPDDIFGIDLSTLPVAPQGLVGDKGKHTWNILSAGGCLGVGINKDNVTFQHTELSKGQIAQIKKCREIVMMRLRERSVNEMRSEFDGYHELFEESGCRLRTNVRVQMSGIWQSATIFLSKNLPHGHFRIRVFTPGMITDHVNDDRVEGPRRQHHQFEPTYVASTSMLEQLITIPLLDMLCIRRLPHSVKQWTLVLYTANDHFIITFERDTDMLNWFDRVTDYIRSVQEAHLIPPNQAIWTLTSEGDVFYSMPVPSNVTDHSSRIWLPVAGIFSQISAGPRGIVWGVSPDNNLYCYTRGYGGGAHDMGKNLEVFSVTKTMFAVENQRYVLLKGFQPCKDNDRMPKWEDMLGNEIESENQLHLPNGNWKWSSDWTVDKTDNCDTDGWQYATNFHSSFSSNSGRGARKRKKLRTAKLTCKAPWKQILMKMVRVKEVVLEHYSYKRNSEVVVAWALCTGGNLLYRSGVSPQCPEGTKWEHVGIDYQLDSIALDAFCNLWAICTDGSAYFRQGISEASPIGVRWMHINKPSNNVSLAKIAAGRYAVWALDTAGNSYIRTKISNIREFGVDWEEVVSPTLHCISVNKSDQVFGVLEQDRSLVFREGVTGECLGGTSWGTVLTQDWSDVCVSSSTQEHHWDEVDDLMGMKMQRYRMKVWVSLREAKIFLTDWPQFEEYCPGYQPGQTVCIREENGHWLETVLDKVNGDGTYEVKVTGVFTNSLRTVGDHDLIADVPPHITYVSRGTLVLVRLGIISNTYCECIIDSVSDDQRLNVSEVNGKKRSAANVMLAAVRLSPVPPHSDIYYIDRMRRYSLFDEGSTQSVAV